jgi:thiosulfate/3-mercaptopyruvate sulfurtransferase
MKKKYPYGKGIVKWISTDWLEKYLEDKNIMILDCQPNIHDYIQEHIPGAIYLNEGVLRISERGLAGKYIPADAMQSILQRVGLKSDIPVVVYTGTGAYKGWGDGLEQTMMAYSLARFGHKNIYVLDGGLDKWKVEGKPLTKVFPQVATSDFTVEMHGEFYLEYEQFKVMKDKENVILLDARPSAVYEGQGPWIKPGHIPGAVNLPWANLMEDSNKRLLKADKELQAIIHEHDISPHKTIICSCGTGREATNEFLLFKWYLGYPEVKIYEGSFTEWTSYPENPTVTGKKPR